MQKSFKWLLNCCKLRVFSKVKINAVIIIFAPKTLFAKFLHRMLFTSFILDYAMSPTTQRQLNFLLAVGRIISGQSLGKIIIITLSFKAGASKNKNIDHGVKVTCAIMSTQVTYETDHMSVLCHCTKSSALNFWGFWYFMI